MIFTAKNASKTIRLLQHSSAQSFYSIHLFGYLCRYVYLRVHAFFCLSLQSSIHNLVFDFQVHEFLMKNELKSTKTKRILV
jgi:hypothetical protein